MLEKMADFWDEEIEAMLDALTSLIEPMLDCFSRRDRGRHRDRDVPADLQAERSSFAEQKLGRSCSRKGRADRKIRPLYFLASCSSLDGIELDLARPIRIVSGQTTRRFRSAFPQAARDPSAIESLGLFRSPQ